MSSSVLGVTAPSLGAFARIQSIVKYDVKKIIYLTILVNLITLAPTLYMLEVYGRVITSRSLETLLMLTMAVVLLYAFSEMLDWVRGNLMHAMAMKIDESIKDRVYAGVFEIQRKKNIPLKGGFSDLRVLRDFISSPVFLSLLDVPVSLMFWFLIFLIDSRMGLFSLAGLFIQFLVIVFTEKHIKPRLDLASQAHSQSMFHADAVMKNAQVIYSMNIYRGIYDRWIKLQRRYLVNQADASSYAALNNATTKFLQGLVGSMLLGLGALLTLTGHLSDSGVLMIVASILGGRMMMPVVQAAGSWKLIADARLAINNLDDLFKSTSEPHDVMPLPPPEGHLTVDHLAVLAPGTKTLVLSGVSFQLKPGQVLGVIGPTGAGKSTLLKAILGLVPLYGGMVRLDGADMQRWDHDRLGPHIGYLPQEVLLLDGSIAQNISRFSGGDLSEVIRVAKMVGLHDFIESLPEAYDTMVSDVGLNLSGGEKQRLGLARALFGQPKLLVMDEPNANLDESAKNHLLALLKDLRLQGTAILITTHHPDLVIASDRLLLLVNGVVQYSGTRDEVLNQLKKKQS